MAHGPLAVHRLQSIACFPMLSNVRAHANVQKINESWMCEEEPEALERSATAKVGMCCNVLLGSSYHLGMTVHLRGAPEAVGRARATSTAKPSLVGFVPSALLFCDDAPDAKHCIAVGRCIFATQPACLLPPLPNAPPQHELPHFEMYRGEADDSEGFKEPGQSIASGGWMAMRGWVGWRWWQPSMAHCATSLHVPARHGVYCTAHLQLQPARRKPCSLVVCPAWLAPLVSLVCLLQHCPAAGATLELMAWKGRTSEAAVGGCTMCSWPAIRCHTAHTALTADRIHDTHAPCFSPLLPPSAPLAQPMPLSPFCLPPVALPRMGGEAEDFIFWNDEGESKERPS